MAIQKCRLKALLIDSLITHPPQPSRSERWSPQATDAFFVMKVAEIRPASLYPILIVAVSMIGFISIKAGRDAVYFSGGGLQQLPLLYVFMAMAAIPAAMMHLEAIARWGAHTARIRVFRLAALIFLSFVPFADPQYRIPMFVFFVLVPVVFAAVFASAWLLAGELLENAGPEEVSWTYSRIGAGSMAGGVLGGLLAKSLAFFLAPRFLIVAGALMLWMASLIISRAHRSRLIPEVRSLGADDPPRESRPDPGLEGMQRSLHLMRAPYIVGLVGISALGAVIAVCIDFQFYALATFSGKVDVQFFGTVYALLNFAALGLQLGVAPRLQSDYGVAGALMILPLSILGGAGLAMASSTLVSQSILKITEGGVKASIHRSLWEQVFLPITGANRAMTKVVVDGLFARIAEGVLGVVLYIWIQSVPRLDGELNLFWLSLVIVAAALLWVPLNFFIAKTCSRVNETDPLIRLPAS